MVGESERAKEMYKRETAAFIALLARVLAQKRNKKNSENKRERRGVERKVGWGKMNQGSTV